MIHESKVMSDEYIQFTRFRSVMFVTSHARGLCLGSGILESGMPESQIRNPKSWNGFYLRAEIDL